MYVDLKNNSFLHLDPLFTDTMPDLTVLELINGIGGIHRATDLAASHLTAEEHPGHVPGNQTLRGPCAHVPPVNHTTHKPGQASRH